MNDSAKTPDSASSANSAKPANSDETAEAPRKMSAKQRRKAEQRKQIKVVLSIVVLVAIVVLAVLGFNWWRGRHNETMPEDQRIIAVVGDEEVEIPPYAACEFDDDDCDQREPFELDFKGQKSVTLKLPQDVYDHDWALLRVYDDPEMQKNEYHKANETPEVTLSAQSPEKKKDGKHYQLTVLEIHSLLIGQDSDGEETPVSTIWSISPKNADDKD